MSLAKEFILLILISLGLPAAFAVTGDQLNRKMFN